MSELFNKALDAISIDDINLLIEEGYPEGTLIEFKQELPSKNNRIDPWLEGKSSISEYARNQLLKEIVAFANGVGGYLIIGIVESEDKPSRAIGIKPLPRCAELAEKIRLQTRDCISPKLPLIHTRGVMLNEDGSGVVVVYVPQSRIAPHRLEPLHCYIRRNDRSEKMTMREIQELTLQRSHLMHDLDRQFKTKHETFQKLMEKSFRSKDCHGIRVTLIPTSTEVWLDNVYKNHLVQPIQWSILAKHGRRPHSLDSLKHFRSNRERPVLRGTRHETETSSHKTIQEIYCNGTIEYKFLTLFQDESPGNDRVYPQWVLSFAINAMLTAHQFRQAAGFPNIEYGMEVEISRRKGPPYLGQFTGREIFEFETNPLIFPRLSIGLPEEFPNVMKILFRDLWNSVGVESSPDFEIQLPKEIYEL